MQVDKGIRVDTVGAVSPIAFRLDPGSGVPTYLQLVQQVEHALRLGYLAPGEQLPGCARSSRTWRSTRTRC